MQTPREQMKPRGNKTKAEERHIKTFVQHHLTLDSAEHRNLDSRVREGAKIGGRPLFRGEPIPSLSERKERAMGGTSGERTGSLVMPDAKFYERCHPLAPLPLLPFFPLSSRQRRPAPFSPSFFCSTSCLFFFTFALFPFILSLSCHFPRSSGVSIVNPTVVWLSRVRVRARTNPARKGEGRNLGAESNVPREQKESAGTDWYPCRPGYSP